MLNKIGVNAINYFEMCDLWILLRIILHYIKYQPDCKTDHNPSASLSEGSTRPVITAKQNKNKPKEAPMELFLVAQNFKSVVHVPWTLGCLATCLVFSFTTFLPKEFLSLIACRSTSSGSIFFTHITLSFLFPVHLAKKNSYLTSHKRERERERERYLW